MSTPRIEEKRNADLKRSLGEHPTEAVQLPGFFEDREAAVPASFVGPTGKFGKTNYQLDLNLQQRQSLERKETLLNRDKESETTRRVDTILKQSAKITTPGRTDQESDGVTSLEGSESELLMTGKKGSGKEMLNGPQRAKSQRSMDLGHEPKAGTTILEMTEETIDEQQQKTPKAATLRDANNMLDMQEHQLTRLTSGRSSNPTLNNYLCNKYTPYI